MAGKAPDTQGTVRIWEPDCKKLRITCVCYGLAALLVLASTPWTSDRLTMLFGVLLTAFAFSSQALRRPCYLATGDVGISITTAKSSRALRWIDIFAAVWILNPGTGDNPRIRLWASSVVEINLTGYPRELQRELFGWSKLRANLRPHPARPGVFLDAEKLRSSCSSLLEPPNADIRRKVLEGDSLAAARLYRGRCGARWEQAKMATDWLDLLLEVMEPQVVLKARIKTPELRGKLQDLLNAGRREEAIKLFRRRTGACPQVASDTVHLLGFSGSIAAGHSSN